MQLLRFIHDIIRLFYFPSLANDQCFATEDLSKEEIQKILQLIHQKEAKDNATYS